MALITSGLWLNQAFRSLFYAYRSARREPFYCISANFGALSSRCPLDICL